MFVDANIFMDVLAKREGWKTSIQIIDKVRKEQCKGFISSLTASLLYYLQREEKNEDQARKEMSTIIQGFEIIPVTKDIIDLALDSNMEDFEDAIQYYCAKKSNSKKIVTRNTRHFPKGTNIKITEPEEMLKREGND